MVDIDSFYKLFRILGTKDKTVKVFEGNHADNRPHELEMEIIQFVISSFKKKKNINNQKINITPQSKKIYI